MRRKVEKTRAVLSKMLQSWRVFIAFSLLLVLLLTSTSHSLETEIENSLNNGDYSIAYTRLLEHISKNPGDPDCLYYLGVSASSGNMSSLYLKDYLQKYPDGEHVNSALELLMDYYSAAGMLITASKLNNNPGNENPGLIENRYKMALNKQLMGEYSSSKDLFQEVSDIGQAGISDWARLGIADCLLLMEKHDKALLAYKNQVDTNPKSPVFPFALIGISEAYRNLGNIEKAGVFYELYKDRFENSPGNPEIEAALLEGRASENSKKLHTLIDVDYYIQVGVFARKSNATTCLKNFRNARYRTRMISFRENDKTFYRIIIGPYGNKSKAKKEKSRLEQSQGEVYTIFIQ